MNASAVGEVFLTPALCLAETTNVAAEALTDVHAGQVGYRSLIDLQTISDKSFDLAVGRSIADDDE